MLRQRPKPETKIVTRRRNRGDRAILVAVSEMLKDKSYQLQVRHDFAVQLIDSVLETETVEVTTRRVA